MLDPKTSDAYYHSADDDGNSRKSTSFHQGIRMSVRFGAYIMDVSARRLRRGSADVHLSPKAFDLLSLLIARRPSVVEKADLRRALWRDVHVVEATLSNLVAEIRAALDEGSTDPSHIRTVHGVGYAFAMDATETFPRGAAPDDHVAYWVVWKERAIPLSAKDNGVGRDPSCAVWIDAGGVSRRHARIRVGGPDRQEAVTIEDLGSTNGTCVRGQRIEGVEPLVHGDRIRLGDATLLFRSRLSEAATRRIKRDRDRS